MEYNQQCGTVGRVQCDLSRRVAIAQSGQQVELLRNQVSRWSYCAIGSASGAIVQSDQRVELLHNRVSGWSYCAIWSAGGAIAQ